MKVGLGLFQAVQTGLVLTEKRQTSQSIVSQSPHSVNMIFYMCHMGNRHFLGGGMRAKGHDAMNSDIGELNLGRRPTSRSHC